MDDGLHVSTRGGPVENAICHCGQLQSLSLNLKLNLCASPVSTLSNAAAKKQIPVKRLTLKSELTDLGINYKRAESFEYVYK